MHERCVCARIFTCQGAYGYAVELAVLSSASSLRLNVGTPYWLLQKIYLLIRASAGASHHPSQMLLPKDGYSHVSRLLSSIDNPACSVVSAMGAPLSLRPRGFAQFFKKSIILLSLDCNIHLDAGTRIKKTKVQVLIGGSYLIICDADVAHRYCNGTVVQHLTQQLQCS